MPLFGVVWKKFGERRTRECTPVWRFEGKALFTQFMGAAQWNENKDQLFIKISGGQNNVLKDWETGPTLQAHTRCMSTMFMVNVNLQVLVNTLGSPIEISLWRDEFNFERSLFILASNETGFFDTNVREPLAFDSDYAYSFKTTDGSIPLQDSAHKFAGILTCRMNLGGGG